MCFLLVQVHVLRKIRLSIWITHNIIYKAYIEELCKKSRNLLNLFCKAEVTPNMWQKAVESKFAKIPEDFSDVVFSI